MVQRSAKWIRSRKFTAKRLDPPLIPLISVVMPVYNTGPFLRQAIESILNQSYPHFEFLIFDDGSIDDSLAIIQSYQDSRIVCYTSMVNLGYVHWLNKGLQEAKGSFIARMDSDDVAHPLRFAKQVQIFKQSKHIGVCGSWVQPIKKGKKGKIWCFSQYDSAIKTDFLFQNPLAHPAVMIRRALLKEQLISYNVEYFPAEDYFLWFQLHKITQFYNIPEVLLYYRVHDNQTSSLNDTLQTNIKKILKYFVLESGICSEIDINKYEELVIGPWQQTDAYLKASGTFLTQLKTSNKNQNYFSIDYFNRKIEELFWKQCYFANNKYCDGVKAYFSFSEGFFRPRFKLIVIAYIKSHLNTLHNLMNTFIKQQTK